MGPGPAVRVGEFWTAGKRFWVGVERAGCHASVTRRTGDDGWLETGDGVGSKEA
jgi:hypothetical protein